MDLLIILGFIAFIFFLMFFSQNGKINWVLPILFSVLIVIIPICYQNGAAINVNNQLDKYSIYTNQIEVHYDEIHDEYTIVYVDSIDVTNIYKTASISKAEYETLSKAFNILEDFEAVEKITKDFD